MSCSSARAPQISHDAVQVAPVRVGDAPRSNDYMQPKNAVARLKVFVGHIGDTWVHAIHRQEYFHSMTRNEELAHALRDTYAAHVHNAVTDMFVMDLIREIGAIV